MVDGDRRQDDVFGVLPNRDSVSIFLARASFKRGFLCSLGSHLLQFVSALAFLSISLSFISLPL
jgi:hypothetical protein